MPFEDFSSVWLEFREEVFHFIQHSVRVDADAEDILQDVATLALANWHALRDREKARAWIFQIARNLIKRHYAVSSRQVVFETRDIDALMRQYDRIDMDELAAREFLSRLDSEWAAAVVLNLEYGYNAREIADMLGNRRKAKTIQNRITIIVKLLAAAVYGEGGEHEAKGSRTEHST